MSYTTKSNIENLFGTKLNENSFNNLKKKLNIKNPNRTFLEEDMLNKGYTIDYVSKKSKISKKKINKYFKNNKSKLSMPELKKICSVINSDPHLYLDKSFKEDSIGKYYYDYRDSLKTIRKFKSYEIASIASSPRSPDLSGYFINVKNKTKKDTLDILDSNCSHYLVTKGHVVSFLKIDNKVKKINMKEGDSVWVSSYTQHGFSGSGALIKISDGQNFNYLEKIDLSNTYNLKKTLSRGRKDKVNWGYDVR